MNGYVALLLGINVGGKNIIRMTDLKACFEDLGFTGVTTYIQSGNVLFTAGRAGLRPAPTIEAALAERFGYKASVVLRTGKELQSIVARAPKGFGMKPAAYRHDVIFLKEPLTAPVAMKSVSSRDGVDEA